MDLFGEKKGFLLIKLLFQVEFSICSLPICITALVTFILFFEIFLRSNSEKKQLFKNLSMWGIIVLVVVIISYLIFA